MLVESALGFFMEEHTAVFEYELRAEDITHTCGKPYRVRFLNNDGQYVLDRDVFGDAYRVVLTAVCDLCATGSGSPSTAYNYCNIMFAGEHLRSFSHVENALEMIQFQLRHSWSELKEHLREHMSRLDPFRGAEVAQWLTDYLLKHGEMGVYQLINECRLRNLNPDAVQKFAEKIGFLGERDDDLSKVYDYMPRYVSAETMPTLFGVTGLKPLKLRLPAEHPLAA